jgi:hypothetical protein
MATYGEFNFLLIYKANKLHVKVNSLLSSSSSELAHSSSPIPFPILILFALLFQFIADFKLAITFLSEA